MAQEPLLPVTVPGVNAYAEKSVAAGDTVSLRVTSDQDFLMGVVRLGPSLDCPAASDVQIFDYQPFTKQTQPITPGSYVNIDNNLPPPQEPPSSLTLECWVRPWKLDGWQGLITQFTDPVACGFGLFISATGEVASNGQVAFYVGDGGQKNLDWLNNSSSLLSLYQWAHVVGVWDSQTNTASIWINGCQTKSWSIPKPFQLVPGDAPLRLAASGFVDESGQRRTGVTLDGDLAMPAIYSRALTAAEIQLRYSQQGLQTPSPDGLLGCWPLKEEAGANLSDISSFKRDGLIINHATWMIGGPSFDSAAVPRYGTYNPNDDPKRGHGLRFASDDLYDCGWNVTQQYRIPLDAKLGIYTGRILYGPNNQTVYDVTFVVSRGKTSPKPKAKMLVLCATNTWLAYNTAPFNGITSQRAHITQSGRKLKQVSIADAIAGPVPNSPDYSCYQNHHDDVNSTQQYGQPTYYLGVNLPWPEAGPYVTVPLASNTSQPSSYSHLVRAERFLHVWLEQNKYDFDVATDFDLSRDPQLLDGYEVLVINGHSEYWPIPAYLNVLNFLQKHGNLIVLSGNTMFWRVAFNEDQSVMECRKFDDGVDLIGGRPHSTIGELWYSTDGQRGSLMREAGYPAYPVIGLDCAGWYEDFGGYDPKRFYTYQCADESTLFTTPNPTGLKKGETFGFGIWTDGKTIKAIGHEFDIRVVTPQMCSVPPDSALPAGAPLPSEPRDIETLAISQQKVSETVFDYYTRYYLAPPQDWMVCQMIHWRRPRGGRVFNAGSIAFGWVLTVDAKLQALTKNVLDAFGVVVPTTKSRPRMKTKSDRQAVPGKAPTRKLSKGGSPSGRGAFAKSRSAKPVTPGSVAEPQSRPQGARKKRRDAG